MKSRQKLSPLQIHLIGGALAVVSGIVVRPFNETAHSVVVAIALAICLYAIYRYFKN